MPTTQNGPTWEDVAVINPDGEYGLRAQVKGDAVYLQAIDMNAACFHRSISPRHALRLATQLIEAANAALDAGDPA